MSIKGRSILGALLFFGGLLLIAGAGVYKSSDRIRYERNIERQRGDLALPARTGPHVLMILGALASVGGVVLIGFAARDMVAEIGSAGSAAERAMQRELMEKKDPKPKP